MIRYNIYPSLLDSYDNYLKAGDIYDKYWGNSDAPPFTYEEFARQSFQDLIDKINRVKRDLIKADIGTAFNEIVDCMVLGQKSDKMEIDKVLQDGRVVEIKAHYNSRTFSFPIEMCRLFANLYSGAIPQMLVEGEIDTSFGSVRLYGYLDELLPQKVCDIKTTGSYESFKFKGNNQHLVYPYCLRRMGNDIDLFSYDVAHIKSNITKDDPSPKEVHVSFLGYYREEYGYIPERDEPILRKRIESFISFLECNRHLITDKKIFNDL